MTKAKLKLNSRNPNEKKIYVVQVATLLFSMLSYVEVDHANGGCGHLSATRVLILCLLLLLLFLLQMRPLVAAKVRP